MHVLLGAGSGIGEAVAGIVAEREPGGAGWVLADRNADAVAAVAERLGLNEALVVSADLTDQASLAVAPSWAAFPISLASSISAETTVLNSKPSKSAVTAATVWWTLRRSARTTSSDGSAPSPPGGASSSVHTRRSQRAVPSMPAPDHGAPWSQRAKNIR